MKRIFSFLTLLLFTVGLSAQPAIIPQIRHPFGAAGADTNGYTGFVPAPQAGDHWKTLLGNATWGSGTIATQLFNVGDSFTAGAGATTYPLTYAGTLATNMGIAAATNLANGSFTIADASWSVFSGWVVTNTIGGANHVFRSPAGITEDQQWTVLIGFNDIRTSGTTPAMFRKGLDHLIRYLCIPSAIKRPAISPDDSTGSWTEIGWPGTFGEIGAYSSSGTLTFSNVIGSEVSVGYLAWGTNYGGTITVSVDGTYTSTNATASAAYGNREYIYGTDPSIPDHVGPYGNGKVDFCPHVAIATGLGVGAHTVVVTASANPVYVLWVAGNGWKRTVRAGPNVFVGSIPRQYPWNAGGTDALHRAFNSQLQSSIAAARASGHRVAAAPTGEFYDPLSEQSIDGVHPGIGHASIAQAFQVAMQPDLASMSGASYTEGAVAGIDGAFNSLLVGDGTTATGITLGSGGSTIQRDTSGKSAFLLTPPSQAAASGTETVLNLPVSVAQTGTAIYRGLYMPITETSVGGGSSYPIHVTVGSTNVFTLKRLGGASMQAWDNPAGASWNFLGTSNTSSQISLTAAQDGLDRSLLVTGNGIQAYVRSTGATANLGIQTASNGRVIVGDGTTTTGLTLGLNGPTISRDSVGKNELVLTPPSLVAASGTERGLYIPLTVAQTGSGTYRGLHVDVTETTVGGSASYPLLVTRASTNLVQINRIGGGQFLAWDNPNGASWLFGGTSNTSSQVKLTAAQDGLDRELMLTGNAVYARTRSTTAAANLAISGAGGYAIVGANAASSGLKVGTVGTGLQNILAGTATLVSGTVTVANANAATASLLWLTHRTAGGTLGHLSYTIDNGVGFTITSTEAAETNVVNWLLITPN